MKILIVNVFFPPQAYGGATLICSDIAEGLLKHPEWNIDPVILTTDAYNRAPSPIQRDMSFGYPVFRATSDIGDDETSYPPMSEVILRVIEEESIDLVNFHAIQRFGLEMVHACRTEGIPYVITMHDGWWLRDHMFFMEDLLALDSEKVAEGEVLRDAWAQIRDRRQAQAPRGMSTRRRATAKAIAGAAAVVVVSEAFGRVLEEEGLTRGEVIENGIPDFLFDAHRRPASNASQRVGYLAGEARHKGYDLFRHSVALLGAFDGNVTVVSDELPPETKSIEMWGRTLVTRVGRMPRRGIYELMRNLDTVVLPSIIPESYGMLAREALLCGCRIVITDLGGLAELADLPGVFVVEPESAAIAIAIAELGSGGAKREFDPHELARIRGRVRSASSMTRDYVRLFERVVGLRAEN